MPVGVLHHSCSGASHFRAVTLRQICHCNGTSLQAQGATACCWPEATFKQHSRRQPRHLLMSGRTSYIMRRNTDHIDTSTDAASVGPRADDIGDN
mgnify:CR=1 FL=1